MTNDLLIALKQIADYEGDPNTPVYNSVRKSAIARAAIHNHTTPQSAPVDGDDELQRLLTDARYGNGLLQHRIDVLNRLLEKAAGHVVGALRDDIKNALTTPPPASQERGGYYKTASGLWRMRAPTASPPSSAAEASINPPEIDSKLIPDAAEQAKPDVLDRMSADVGPITAARCK